MEQAGSDRKESNYSVRQEIHSSESARDWFASINSNLMEASSPLPAAPNKICCYDNELHVRPPQALQLGLSSQNIEREHMFDKVVTPSDVGKLNRLVIPKQHAEKYFPLDSSNEKGFILNFEDILTGKPWRFRYSYWNSSQSYVMTKGWSRFVKEKKLNAGDIVSFQRGVGEAADQKHRLFIDWKRRRPITSTTLLPFHTQFYSSWTPLTRIHPSINFQVPNNPSSQYYFSTNGYNVGGYNYMGQMVTNNIASSVYLTSPEMIGTVRGRAGGVVGEMIPVVFESLPVVKGKKVAAAAAAKRMRLFGVNMECTISSDTSTSDDHFETLFSSSSAIPIVPAEDLINQYPLQSTLFQPSSTKMYNAIVPIADNGLTSSMSLNLEI